MKPTLLRSLLFFLLVALVVWRPMVARADVTAAVIGIVTDSSGQLLPGATVELTNATTGYHRSLVADGTGGYEFLSVPVGEGYTVEVSSKGFAKSAQQGITLLVNQRFRADFQLKVGSVTEQVTVSADSTQVDTATNQIGDLIDDKKILSLPLNGRSYTDLMGLQPGVVPITSGAAFNDRPVSGGLNAGVVSVNGGQESSNGFLINGGDVEEPKNNGAAVIPSLDAIQEFRILTSTYDAEYGRFAGGIVNVITKSGTNQFHGSVYEFLRNEDLNAKNYFDTTRATFKRNQFGYSFGGPVVKNHLFFFSDYQGTREVRGQSGGSVNVPSTLEAGGDFSDVGTTGFSALTGVVQGNGPHSMPITLTQRLGYTVTSGEPYWIAGCNTLADAQAGTCVFPGQQIPKAAWDPAAAGTVQFIPSPTGLSGSTPVFSTSSANTSLNDDKFGERATWNNARTGDWSFYFSYDNSSAFSPFAGGNIPGFAGTVPQKAYQANVSNTHVFNASTVNEIRLNYTRSTIFQTHPSGVGLGSLSSFGFSTGPLGLVGTAPQVEGVPSIKIGGSYGISMGVVAFAINQVNNTYQIADVFSKVVGRHSLKFGGEARKAEVNEFNISSPNGAFSFDGSETGNGFADYLIGAPNGFQQQSYSTFFTRGYYGGVFAQDSYRIRPNLTINAGLRWDYIQPWYEKNGWLNAIDWGVRSTVYPGAPTGWIFPGDKGLPKTISHTPHDNFSPRLGINWSPSASSGALGKILGGTGQTSIRAGAGMYYTSIQDQPSFYTIGDAPFGLYYSSAAQIYFNSPYEDRLHGNDPGQRFPFTNPKPGDPIDWSVYLPIGGSPGVALGNVTPYVLQFNLNIQRELPGSTIVSLGYVGSRGHHLLAQEESNPGIAATCLQLAAELPAGQGCGPHGEDQIYQLPGGGTVNGTRPHSVTSGDFLSQGLLDFTGNDYNTTIGNSDYNSLQASLTKQMGISRFQASYTWSKSLDNASGNKDSINPFDPNFTRGLSLFNMAQNLTISYAVAMPKFQGSSALVRNTIGGWELTGITRFTSGLPVNIRNPTDRCLCALFLDTPDWDGKTVKKYDPRSSAKNIYFNTAGFSLEPLGTLGTSPRRFFSGPGLNNWDVALRKTVPIHERYSFEFRAEFFNVMNHAQFNLPQGSFASASFGRVTSARDPRIGQVALRFAF